jgi:hypothetical protein
MTVEALTMAAAHRKREPLDAEAKYRRASSVADEESIQG